MTPLDMVRLTDLMARGSGSRDITIALIDGPIQAQHHDLRDASIVASGAGRDVSCSLAASPACLHATFVAGILVGRRASGAPGICPGCTLLVRPIFTEWLRAPIPSPNATPAVLATAMVECMNSGARIINLSLALHHTPLRREHELSDALDQAARRGVIVVAAAGNDGTVTSSVVTRHPWVVPVVACGREGRPMDASNLGRSIGQKGLSAPGEGVVSLALDGASASFAGTSVATPFVTGTMALLWSAFPTATASAIIAATTRGRGTRRTSILPPLLDAEAAFRSLEQAQGYRP